MTTILPGQSKIKQQPLQSDVALWSADAPREIPPQKEVTALATVNNLKEKVERFSLADLSAKLPIMALIVALLLACTCISHLSVFGSNNDPLVDPALVAAWQDSRPYQLHGALACESSAAGDISVYAVSAATRTGLPSCRLPGSKRDVGFGVLTSDLGSRIIGVEKDELGRVKAISISVSAVANKADHSGIAWLTSAFDASRNGLEFGQQDIPYREPAEAENTLMWPAYALTQILGEPRKETVYMRLLGQDPGFDSELGTAKTNAVLVHVSAYGELLAVGGAKNTQEIRISAGRDKLDLGALDAGGGKNAIVGSGGAADDDVLAIVGSGRTASDGKNAIVGSGSVVVEFDYSADGRIDDIRLVENH